MRKIPKELSCTFLRRKDNALKSLVTITLQIHWANLSTNLQQGLYPQFMVLPGEPQHLLEHVCGTA